MRNKHEDVVVGEDATVEREPSPFSWSGPPPAASTPLHTVSLAKSNQSPRRRKMEQTHLLPTAQQQQPLIVPSLPSSQVADTRPSQQDATTPLEDLVEQLREENRLLQLSNKAVKEAAWDAKKFEFGRAAALSEALSLCAENADQLRAENDKLKGRVAELEHLKILQVHLLRQFDLDDTSFEGEKKLVDAISCRLRKEEEERRERRAAKIPPPPCLRCLKYEEARTRNELLLIERDAFHQIVASRDALEAAEKDKARQARENEVNCMWEEDLRSHHLQLHEMQQQVNLLDRVLQKLRQAESDAARWREKYANLKEAAKRHVAQLVAAHEEEMKGARLKYLRCSPSNVIVKSMFVSLAKSQIAGMRSFALLALKQRQLALLRQELRVVKTTFQAHVGALQQEVMEALENCLPITWSVVPVVGGKKAEGRQRHLSDGTFPLPPRKPARR